MPDLTARIISVTSLILTILKIGYDWWNNRRRPTVQVEQAKIRDKNAVSISVVNKGKRPTTIKGLGVFFDDGRALGSGHMTFNRRGTKTVTVDSEMYSTDFPKSLGDGEPASVYYDFETLSDYYAEGAKIDKIIAWDAEGNEYKGEIPRYLRERLDQLGSQRQNNDDSP